ncbi:MAG: SIMPL domain-containing protein [Granulosicoccus sp.]
MVISTKGCKTNLIAARTYWLLIGLIALCAACAKKGHAQPTYETLYDVYRLSSEASVEVDNDRMVATLVVEEEHEDASALANELNLVMSWAVEILQPYETIAVRSRDYQTSPRYENSTARRLIGWRAKQIIELETDDFIAAGKAIAQLQEKLKVQNIRLSVKPSTRKTATDILIENALNSFKERAQQVQRNMNSSSYRILDVDIHTQQNLSSYDDARLMSVDEEYSPGVATAPTIVAGSSTVQVQINGRIQLD